MRTIWKHELLAAPTPPEGYEPRSVPSGSHVRHVGLQASGWIGVWYEVPDTEARSVTWHLVVTGTGRAAPHGGEWLGTVIDGQLIWHVWRTEVLP